ncbi:unnamed protein product [Citrullus colocynthis]|uniref:Uncharacterized protein n=1 Tax=Citrullus colocynthis TaxID=252529 RepID=A0ABP0Z7N0_9ROSI
MAVLLSNQLQFNNISITLSRHYDPTTSFSQSNLPKMTFGVLVLFCSVLKLTEDCWNCSGFLTDSSDPIRLWLLVRVLGV